MIGYVQAALAVGRRLAPLVALAAVIATSGAAGWTVATWRGDAALDQLRAVHAKALESAATAARIAEAEARRQERAELAAKIAESERIVREAQTIIEDVRRQSAGAAAAADRLRDAARAYAARRCPAPAAGAPAAAGGSPAGPAAGDLYADMLGGLADRARAYALEADERRVKGLACEAHHDKPRQAAAAAP